jgi:hypothetical protein
MPDAAANKLAAPCPTLPSLAAPQAARMQHMDPQQTAAGRPLLLLLLLLLPAPLQRPLQTPPRLPRSRPH